MTKIFNFFKKAYEKKIDASGLAVFRIVYGIVLMLDVVQLFYFRHLIFDEIPFLEPSEIQFTIPLILWMVTIVFLIIGLYTKYVTVINYLFTLVFIATISTYEYHMYYLYVSVNFVLMFINLSKTGSIDALRLKLKYSNIRFTYKQTRNTSVLNYFTIILVGIAFVYFDSVFYKYLSPLWLNGLGVWLPASVPQITHSDLTFFLNQKWLMLFLGYLTLIFETIFIFTFFLKNWRLPLFLIGLGLHIGIIISFPIPRFGFGIIAIYLLMVPVEFWIFLRNKISFRSPKIMFYYDEECPLCKRTQLILGHLDFFNAIEFKGVQTYGVKDERLKDKSQDMLLHNIYSITKKNKVLHGIDTYITSFKYIPLLFPVSLLLAIPGIYHIGKWLYKKVADNRYVERCTEENCGFTPPNIPMNNDNMKITKKLRLVDLRITAIAVGLILLSFLQLNVIYNSPVSRGVKKHIGLQDTKLENFIQEISVPLKYISQSLFGITKHEVFVDSHFKGYNHTIAIKYNNIWLPITNEDGSLGPWQIGPIWAKWGFRVNSAEINREILEEGIRDFTVFWSRKNDISLDYAKFKVLVKKNSSPSGWERNFLKNQLDTPWVNGGYVEWRNNEFYSFIKDIENL